MHEPSRFRPKRDAARVRRGESSGWSVEHNPLVGLAEKLRRTEIRMIRHHYEDLGGSESDLAPI
jgi:hypothetical protein